MGHGEGEYMGPGDGEYAGPVFHGIGTFSLNTGPKGNGEGDASG